MRCTFNRVAVLLLVASLALSGCGGASGPGDWRCDDGFCVDIELAEPIRFNEPVPVTITVQTDEDIPGLIIYLAASDPDVLFGSERKWTVDAEVHQTIVVTSTVRFTEEGYFDIYGDAHNKQRGQVVTDYVPVRITRSGGTLNPPPERESGTPAPAELLEETPTYVKPRSPLPTPAPTPTPYPTCPPEFDTSLPEAPLEEWVPHCDWPSGAREMAPEEMSPWKGTSVWVAFPEDIFPHEQFLAHGEDGTTVWREIPRDIVFYPLPLDTFIPITIGVHIEGIPKGPAETVHLELALCLSDPAVQVEGPAQWDLEVRTKERTTFHTRLRFREEGIFEVRVGARDPESGQIAWSGQRVRVAVKESSDVPESPTSEDSSIAPQGQTAGGWEVITFEDFEWVFPSTDWMVLDQSDDVCERYWDYDDYRAHNSNWAAWPANGGDDGLDPADYDYPNDMDTRMIYGPFDLSDAVEAKVWFYLWIEIEEGYDWLSFEVSHDGVNFTKLERFNESDKYWSFEYQYFDDYTGDDSVWVAWRFYSDFGVTREGSWIDDVTIKKKPDGQSWVTIEQEDFEGGFPGSGWSVVDLSDDVCKRYWDDDDYKPYRDDRAAWPANGGDDGLNPEWGNHDYPNDMDTRMIYGPFDLSNAVEAKVWFYLWREIEEGYDWLSFEVSRDGDYFTELEKFDGDADWSFEYKYFDDYVGDDSVWVAWRFFSDYMINYDGPWIDDVTVKKYVPGQVTAQGSFHYYDRDDNQAPARYTRVHLYDADTSGDDDWLGSTTTEDDGSWEIGPLANWDEDEPSPDGRLDLYAVFETDVKDGNTTSRRVTDFGGWAYKWQISTKDNVDDGTVDLGAWSIEEGSNWEPAMWIFQDMRRAWEYIHDNTGTDPGLATARWEEDADCFPIAQGICASFAWPYLPVNGVFIADANVNSPDTIVHELGHQYMYNAMGWWYWTPDTWDDFYQCVIQEHHFFDEKTQLCAWTEGWADFHALAINNDPSESDPCYDWGLGPCGADGRPFENLETPTWSDQNPIGDDVEGRVAGALYDLFDQANDGWDQRSFGFNPIWDIIYTEPEEEDFLDFWGGWVDQGYNGHWAVQAIYQNTIDYDTPPDIANLPDVTVLQGFDRNNAIDLHAHTSDPESSYAELTWYVGADTDPLCGVSIDYWDRVDINPSPGWPGSCDATIVVSDSIKTDDDTFTIDVVPVAARVYLPLIMRNHPPLAPFTTIVLDAPQPDGDNGWYVSDVEVSFTVPPGTVRPRIDYRLNLGDWYTFTAPFTITTEGENLVQIRPAQAVQGPFGLATHRMRLAGSDEEILSFVVKIDQSLPTLAITTPQPITYTHGVTFTLDYQADDAYSDLVAITATLDTQPVTNGQVIDTLALVPGAHEFALAARDGAGHTASQTVAFTVTTTLSGLIDLKHRLYAEGGIYGPGAHGIVQSLDAKLEAAQRNLEAGLPQAAINNLQAFIHEVEAQTGKHITPDAAKLMIEDAQRIIASLSE